MDNDISQYSDIELFQILDLDNPTDRELEAKIYSLIEFSKNNEEPELEKFYMDIFNHFFENEDEEDENTITEGFTTAAAAAAAAAAAPASNQPAAAPAPPPQPPTYTRNLNYTQGNLNPILKETIKRVVSIDSSFRDLTTYPYSTEFTFNLSETLHDVVSLKLYSVHIPYNWYTINQNYGSNFFYLKGVSDGINNGNFDYKISVEYGNYTADTLVSNLNASINTISTQNPDVSFATTAISLNQTNQQSTLTLDIANNYNETNYYLDFPYFDNSLNSIPQLFGYTQNTYNPFSVYSNIFVLAGPTYPVPTLPTTKYVITSDNNHFNIYIYDTTFSATNGQISSFENSTTTPPIDTITVTLTLTVNLSYSVTEIFNNLNEVLNANEKLLESKDETNATISSTISVVDASYSVANGKKYVMNLRPNRKKTTNHKNQKMVIEFPTETTIDNSIWTGDTSCFNFPNQLMELQNIYSEKTSSTTTYLVNSSPFIVLKCIADGYGNYGSGQSQQDVSLNDFVITVQNSTSIGYSLTDYYNAIQTGINAVTTATNGKVIGTIDNNNANSYTEISFSINNVIPGSNFILDTTDSFLNTIFGFSTTLQNGSYTQYFLYSQSFTINNSNKRFVIKPTSTTAGYNRYMSNENIDLTPGAYSLTEIVNELNNIFNTYNSNHLNLSNMSVIANELPDGQTVQMTLVVNVQAILKNADYDLYFFDNSSNVIYYVPPPSPPYPFTYSYYDNEYYWVDNSNNYLKSNSWGGNFGFIDPSYSLINDPIVATKKVQSNLLLLNEYNNYFNITPLYDASGGVYSATETNNIKITLNLPIDNEYTKEAIRDSINEAFQTNPVTKGSYVNTDNYNTLIRLNVNHTFSAKDYSIVFFDTNSFTKCNFGPSASAETTTTDTTLGWILGFRTDTIYYPTPENLTVVTIRDTTKSYYGEYSANAYTYDSTTGIAALTGDTSVNVNLYNYFLIILDDYTQNHLNDGLVTTITAETDVPLPSYATKSSYKCNPTTNVYSISNTSNSANSNRLTNAQIYSANQINASRSNQSSRNVVSSGPYIQDIFGIIPVKTAGLKPGDTYTEFGGTLQIQERVYFGPVNIRRMTVKLMTDKGNVLDLNRQNWSFSLITEQLYNPNKG